MIILVERTGAGEWRYGTEVRGVPQWSGTARRSTEHEGVDLDGPWDLDPTVRLLIRDVGDRDLIRYDTTMVPARAPVPPPAPAEPWKRATAGLAKGVGTSLGDMARRGSMGR